MLILLQPPVAAVSTTVSTQCSRDEEIFPLGSYPASSTLSMPDQLSQDPQSNLTALFYCCSKRPMTNKPRKTFLTYLCILLLLQSGDTEVNPGPRQPKWPCGVCSKGVRWNENAVSCDSCDTWYHQSCMEMPTQMFECLQSSQAVWICASCGLPNFSSSLFSSFNLSTSNSFSCLSDSSLSSVGSPAPSREPLATSTPKRGGPPKKAPQTTKQTNLRVLMVNCQSICNKVQEFHHVLESTQPDIVLGTDSWLNPSIANSEIFPPDYTAFRNDRKSGKSGGGVFIAAKNDLVLTHRPDLETNSEVTWAEIQIVGCRSVYVGCYYRPPSDSEDSLHELSLSLDKVRVAAKSATVWVGGDFNLPDINWASNSIKPDSNKQHLSQIFLDILADSSLEQIVTKPTREENILDLFLTSNPTLVNKVTQAPGLADHNNVFIDVAARPQRLKATPRRVHCYGKADLEALLSDIELFAREFPKTSPENKSVEENWCTFKSRLLGLLEKHVPSKLVRPNHDLPWMNRDTRHAARKKQRWFNLAKKTKSPRVNISRHKNPVRDVFVELIGTM